MNNVKSYLKTKPKLFSVLKSVHQKLRPVWRTIEFFKYHVAILTSKPYFGSHFLAQQAWSNRVPVMSALLKKEIETRSGTPVNVLEVGSWAGSSAIIWAKILKGANNDGSVFCVDPWVFYGSLNPDMRAAVKKNRIFKLFLHNTGTSGVSEKIAILRGTSDLFGGFLKPATFEFVYVDGDHAYTQFKKDLQNYMPMVKDGGVICGDDCELAVSEVDEAFANTHKEEDVVKDPRTQKHFHPGINMALRNIFGDVSMKEGFWAMRRIGNRWEKISL